MERLQGIVDRITYQNAETGYTVARIRPEGRGATPVTVVGETLSLKPGESLLLEGDWATHPQYGKQFKISSYRTVHPSTVEGIRRCRDAGRCRG